MLRELEPVELNEKFAGPGDGKIAGGAKRNVSASDWPSSDDEDDTPAKKRSKQRAAFAKAVAVFDSRRAEEIKSGEVLVVAVKSPKPSVDGGAGLKHLTEIVRSNGTAAVSRYCQPFRVGNSSTTVQMANREQGTVSGTRSIYDMQVPEQVALNQRDSFNDLISSSFGASFQQIGLDEIHGLNSWVMCQETSVNMMKAGSVNDLVFSAVPYVKGKVSPHHNRSNLVEFMLNTGTGQKVVNPRFWKEQMMFFGGGPNGRPLTNLIELAAKIPEWALRENQLSDHYEAMDQWDNFGAGLGGGFFKLVLYGKYAHVFVNFMNSMLVQKGRLSGFYPLFLMRNCINQKSGYGTRNHQFASIDKGAKSSLILLGFFRMANEDVNTLELVSLRSSANDAPLTMINYVP